MMKKIFLSLIIAASAAVPAAAETVAKSYSYFNIRGTTFEQIEKDLSNRGPHVKSTGLRHPGATRMNFTTKIGYANDGRYCRIVSADTVVKARVILPRWKPRGRVDARTESSGIRFSPTSSGTRTAMSRSRKPVHENWNRL